ncbi:MAG TPA: hypothetical protein VG605_15590 [Puia sp.]|nr:hypothetical protein [Puia sp.]
MTLTGDGALNSIASDAGDESSGGGDPLGSKVKMTDIAKAFQDGKTAKSYFFTLFVKQPVYGQRHMKWFPLPSDAQNVGHTFIRLTKVNDDGSVVSQTFGYYPDGGGGDATHPTANSSTFRDNSGHSSDESLTKNISVDQFKNILTLGHAFESARYDLNFKNCTSFGYLAAYSAGIEVNEVWGTWPGNPGNGANPGSLGQSILEGNIKTWKLTTNQEFPLPTTTPG